MAEQQTLVPYEVDRIRDDFPILSRTVYGKPLVYLDNGATTQKPRAVVEAITEEYYSVNANVHRGVHFLSQRATELHEASRETVRRFINARSTNEIVFTRGTTESINLLAYSYGEACLKAGDEVLLSTMEHHSNIVPWQLLQARKGIVLKVIPMNDRGELLLDAYRELFTERTRLVTCPLTCRSSMQTSMSSRVIRSMGRPEWAFSTAKRTGWTGFRPTKAAGR